MPDSLRPEFLEPVAACATPPGVGGIAIVRLSGRDAQSLAQRLLPPARPLPPNQRAFFHALLRHPDTGVPLDEAVVLSFPAPPSYTGEPVVEFQVHGGRLSARRILDVLSAIGVRLATPGEFTRRAFLNGRLDLTEAEAVMDIVAAESDRAANAALEQLSGGLRRKIDPLYAELVALRADVEATLDFDEDAVPGVLSAEVLSSRVDAVLAGIDSLLATWREGRLLREGALVVLAGRPNAGKSSLFNALLSSDRAIVSEEPGTTRDLLEEPLSIDGIPVRLVDTAGLREATGAVERQGVRRAEDQLRRADLRLIVVDATTPDASNLAALPCPADVVVSSSVPTVVAYNKIDLVPDFQPPSGLPAHARTVCTSALDGTGLADLRATLRDSLGVAPSASESAAFVNERHRSLLERAKASLLEARAILISGIRVDSDFPAGGFDAVLGAQPLRDATEALGAITGRDAADDLLDAVFSRFCIGK